MRARTSPVAGSGGLADRDRLTAYRQLLDVGQLQPPGAGAWPVRRQIASADQVPDPLPGHREDDACLRGGDPGIPTSEARRTPSPAPASQLRRPSPDSASRRGSSGQTLPAHWLIGACPRAGNPPCRTSYDWAAINAHARDLYFINSCHDPYGCDDKQGRAMFERLGGTQIVAMTGTSTPVTCRTRPSNCSTSSSTAARPSTSAARARPSGRPWAGLTYRSSGNSRPRSVALNSSRFPVLVSFQTACMAFGVAASPW
jgi:hypothetical protein